MVAEGCDLYSVALHMQGWPVQANHRNDFSLPYSKYKRAKWTIFLIVKTWAVSEVSACLQCTFKLKIKYTPEELLQNI